MEAGFETTAYENCTCPTWTIVCVAEERLSKVTGAEAVRLAALEPPKSCFISRMCTILFKEKDSDLVKNGIFPFLLENIVRYEHSTRSTTDSESWDYPNWFMPLRAASICLLPFHVVPHALIPEAAPRILELRPYLPKIVDTIWNDRELLKKKGVQHPDGMREGIALFFGLCSGVKDLKAILYSDKALEILLICMLDMTRPHWPEKISFVDMIDRFLNPYLAESPDQLPLPADWTSRIFKIYDPQYIILNFTSRLQNKDLLDEALTVTLMPIFRFMQIGSQDADWRRAVVDSNIHIPLVHAVERQLVHGTNTKETTHISAFGKDILLKRIVPHANPTRIYADLFTQTPFVGVVARAWYLGHKSPTIPESDMEKMDWSNILDDLIYWLQGGYNHLHKPPNAFIIDAARVSIELSYTPTLFWVHKQNPLSPGPVSKWRSLFALLDITDATIRERQKLRKKCCHVDCPRRTAGKNSEKKYSCRGCETVFYCDRSCQKLDWQKHKPACDPHHFATNGSMIALYSKKIQS